MRKTLKKERTHKEDKGVEKQKWEEAEGKDSWNTGNRRGSSGEDSDSLPGRAGAGAQSSVTQLPCALSIISGESQLAKEQGGWPYSCKLFLDALFIFDKSFRGSYFISL